MVALAHLFRIRTQQPPITMKPLFTLLLLQISHTLPVFTQSDPNRTASLEMRIATEIREELSYAIPSSAKIQCRLLEQHFGTSGTGASLMMYSMPQVALTIDVSIVWPGTQASAHHTIYAYGRTTLDDAVDDAVDRALMVIDANCNQRMPQSTEPAIASGYN